MNGQVGNASAHEETPVLIAGGSLVGLSTALLLGWHGIPSITVEHHRGAAIHPRAAQISQRTMEVFRSAGVEPIIRRKSEEQFVQDGAIMAVESLAGKEIAWYIPNLNDGVRDVSPTIRLFITQSLLEPILRERAQELGADIRYGTDLVSFEPDADGVTALIRNRDRGEQRTVRARYMIAADGNRSPVRERLGIAMRGRGVMSNSITIYFRGNVGRLLRGRRLSVIYVYNRVLRGFFRLEKPFDSGFLAVNSVGEPEHPITNVVGAGIGEDRCADMIRAAIGTDEIPIEIDNVMTWDARADTAERFSEGPIFLAGDAAHVMPPNGGFGGNTGVQDAHNLAWKLAMVLKGAAGPGLLSTYDSERRPAAAFTVEQAYTRYVTRSAPYLGTDNIQPIVNDLNIELGYRYRSDAISSERPDDLAAHGNPRESAGRPGTRAVHVPLRRAGAELSPLDLFGRRFALLAGADGGAWKAGAREAAERLGLELDVHQIGAGDLADPEQRFLQAYGITSAGAVLVRPDGFVSWRSKGAGQTPGATLTRALASSTCREGAPQNR